MLMMIKYLIVFALKRMRKNIDINLWILIVFILGISGLILTSEFLNAIEEDYSIIITIETKFNYDNDDLLQDLIREINKMGGILEINYDGYLSIKTTERENVNKITELIHENNYKFPVRYDSLRPKFSHMIEKLSKYMYILLLIVSQIMFIIITLKKVNIESTEFAIYKCMGYKSKDVLIMISTQLLLIIAASFIISIILSIFIINVFNYYLQEYINISFNFSTVLNQVLIIIIECFFVCLFSAIEVRKINLVEA